MANPLGFLKDATQLIESIYKDLAQPGVQQVGVALGDVLGLTSTLTLPLKGWQEKRRITFERNMELYREQLQNVDEDKIITVPPEIGVPIIEKFTYVTNEEISNLFVSLLAKASVTDTAGLGHPGFVKMIENLSVDEAKLIQALSKLDTNGYVPFINFQGFFSTQDGRGVRNLCRYLTGLEQGLDLLFTDNIELYFENFVSLGILTCYEDKLVTPVKMYNDLEAKYMPLREMLQSKLVETKRYEGIQTEKGHFKLTYYGETFIKACVTKEIQ